MNGVLHIPSLFEEVVARTSAALQLRTVPLKAHFGYGHYVEITNILTEKGKSPIKKADRYPLIWLVMDFTERYGDIQEYEYCQLPDLQFIIAMDTQAALSAKDRSDKIFKPILYPIYNEFLNQISASGFFSDADPVEHDKIDRPYWGGQESGNGQANLFNDFIDAIQLKRMRLGVNDNCDQFKIF